MKQEPENQDLQFCRLLQSQRVDKPLPPRFRERVWKRIETAESGRAKPTETSVLNWLAILFARPAFATVCAALLLVAGLATGFVRANQASARMDTELAQRYLASVNAYASQVAEP